MNLFLYIILHIRFLHIKLLLTKVIDNDNDNAGGGGVGGGEMQSLELIKNFYQSFIVTITIYKIVIILLLYYYSNYSIIVIILL